MWQEAARRCWCGACSQGRVLNLQPSEHPVRVVAKSRDGGGTYANLVDANGRHQLAAAIIDALDAHGYRIVRDVCKCYTIHEERNVFCPLNAD